MLTHGLNNHRNIFLNHVYVFLYTFTNYYYYYYISSTSCINVMYFVSIVLHCCQSTFEQFWKMRYTRVNLLLLLLLVI